MTGRTGVFLDRDGVINQPPPPEQRYITRPEDFHLMPGIAESIRLLNQRNLPVIVVTNQKCVALGRIDEQALAAIHRRMRELLEAEGARLAEVRYCPHQESDQCDCRKPLPGMILRGAASQHVDLGFSWLMGDQSRDIAAGKAAGCHTLRIGGEEPSGSEAEVRLPDTSALPAWIKEKFPF